MPQLGLIPIIEIIGAAVGATGLGMQLAGVGKPSTGDANKQLQQAQQAQAQADADQRMKAIRASLSNAQEQGGGALGGPQLVDLASVIAGMPGESTGTAGKRALADYLGTGTGTTPGETMTSATYGLSGSQG